MQIGTFQDFTLFNLGPHHMVSIIIHLYGVHHYMVSIIIQIYGVQCAPFIWWGIWWNQLSPLQLVSSPVKPSIKMVANTYFSFHPASLR